MTTKSIFKISIWAVVLFLIGFYFYYEPSVEYGPGIKAPDIPIQKNIKNPQVFEFKEYEITPLAEYSITAKILSIETYSSGREADLSPVDFAVGWGRMSDENVLESISIRQSRRWYYWKTPRFPIPKKEIETSSCNMHIIPADDFIEDEVNDIIKGQIVTLKGFLVEVKGKDNWFWKSSLSRDDTGNHACEVMFVQEVSILP